MMAALTITDELLVKASDLSYVRVCVRGRALRQLRDAATRTVGPDHAVAIRCGQALERGHAYLADLHADVVLRIAGGVAGTLNAALTAAALRAEERHLRAQADARARLAYELDPIDAE